MAELFRPSFFQPDTSAGVPLAGAKLYFYEAGTTTGITTYQDNALGTPHANPVVADASGIFAPIYLGTTVTSYKTVLKTSADVTVQTVDNIALLDATGIFNDNVFTVQDNLDTTKKVQVQVSGVTTGTTRTMTIPDENGTLVVYSSTGAVTVPSTDASANVGPTIDLYRNSASPSASDSIGEIIFNGEDSASNKQEYARIVSVIEDPTSTSEDGKMVLQTMIAGTRTTQIEMTSAGTAVSSLLDLSAGVGQIKFPAIQVPSTNTNTLDDYEEGTWTPTLTANTPGDLSATYTVQTGHYNKVGRLVVIHFHIVTSAFTHTTASGDLLITGAPFTAGFLSNGSANFTGYTNATWPSHLTPRVNTSGTNIRMYRSQSAQATSAAQIGDFPTGGLVEIAGTITYFV